MEEDVRGFRGQTIPEMQAWIDENPGYFAGVTERRMMIEEMKENPYEHYYGYGCPID